jgi:uncharacterized protein YicC (UPF0701 family)
MAGDASTDAHLSAVLAALEMTLARLAQARDPQTANLAYEIQNTIDKIRAELGHLQPMRFATEAATTSQRRVSD